MVCKRERVLVGMLVKLDLNAGRNVVQAWDEVLQQVVWLDV